MENSVFDEKMIAPCGMNCGVCIARFRSRNVCPGCRQDKQGKPSVCTRCIIKKCTYLAETASGYCYECPKFPCTRMKQLDARYRKNYSTSLIGNLNKIRENGIGHFLNEETLNWTCTACGKITSIHRNHCIHCNTLIKPESNPL